MSGSGAQELDMEFRAPSNCWVGGGEGVFERERLLGLLGVLFVLKGHECNHLEL